MAKLQLESSKDNNFTIVDHHNIRNYTKEVQH